MGSEMCIRDSICFVNPVGEILKVYIYKTFSFEEIPEAQKLMEVGKVVVRVGKKTSEE